jgi:alkaline phosphatase
MEAPKGVIRNVDVGLMLADALGGGLTKLNRELFVDLNTTSLKWSVDISDETNPFALIEGFTFPINTDYFMNNDVRMMLPGLTVYAPQTGKLYVSQKAIETVRSLANV